MIDRRKRKLLKWKRKAQDSVPLTPEFLQLGIAVDGSLGSRQMQILSFATKKTPGALRMTDGCSLFNKNAEEFISLKGRHISPSELTKQYSLDNLPKFQALRKTTYHFMIQDANGMVHNFSIDLAVVRAQIPQMMLKKQVSDKIRHHWSECKNVWWGCDISMKPKTFSGNG